MLNLGDPVFVERHSAATASPPFHATLEGVVAFLGTTGFAKGDDWVGIRLTGDSKGKGKNDGSVKGKIYFICEANCGMFVRRNAVTRRQLNRIEELRLRRELGAAASADFVSASPRSTDANAVVQNQTPNSNRRKKSSLQKALSATKSRDSSSWTPPPPRRPTSEPRRKTCIAESIDNSRGIAGALAGSSPASERRTRLDQIRERKAALATNNNAVAQTATCSVTGARSDQSFELTSPPRTRSTRLGDKAGDVTPEDEALACSLREELSSLRGQVVALKDENESLRTAMRAREEREAACALEPKITNNRARPACVLDGSRGDPCCADSIDLVLNDVTDESACDEYANDESNGKGKYDDLIKGVRTPAKPDLERRLAKALLRIALLQEEMDELKSSGMSGKEPLEADREAPLSDRDGNYFSIRLTLNEVPESDFNSFVPVELPEPFEGVISSTDWATFANEANEVIDEWATVTTPLRYKAVLIGICAITPLLLLLQSDSVVAVSLVLSLVSFSVIVLIILSCREAHYRSKVEAFLKGYAEKWPGTIIELKKHRDKYWSCLYLCAYSIEIAPDFDVEGAPRPGIMRHRNLTHENPDDRPTGDDNFGCLEEPLLPADNVTE